MQKWEYLMVETATDKPVDLAYFGSRGWEFCWAGAIGQTTTDAKPQLVFKRPL